MTFKSTLQHKTDNQVDDFKFVFSRLAAAILFFLL